MLESPLTIDRFPACAGGHLVMGLTGWMDGGEVSTGTIAWLTERLDAREFARIRSDDFYVYQMTGEMYGSVGNRPRTKIEGGLVRELKMPANVFRAAESAKLLLFVGSEPHVAWGRYAQAVFEMAAAAGVADIWFVGSVASPVPHTRDTRVISTVSDEGLKPTLEPLGVRMADYEGPCSLVTYMMTRAEEHGVRLATLIAETPIYIQGRNPRAIEAIARKLARLTGLELSFDGLREQGDEWERRVNLHLKDRQRLTKYVGRLEQEHDDEVFKSQIGEIQDYLDDQGVTFE